MELINKIIENGKIDAFEPLFQSLPELLASFSVDVIMWAVIIFMLFFNKYTRTFTIASAILFLIFGG